MGRDAKIERERTWREHLAAWKNSGLSQAAYCRQHGLMQSDFSWWKREIVRRDQGASTPPAFVPMQVALAPVESRGFELLLRGGHTLRFDARVDPAALSRIVRVLEREPAC